MSLNTAHLQEILKAVTGLHVPFKTGTRLDQLAIFILRIFPEPAP
jgi:hypothetical protein